MSNPHHRVDVALLGGGISGLWLLNHLNRRGFNSVLLARSPLGGEQTVASQGIIHGGLKYQFGASRDAADPALEQMPALWRSCLGGHGPVDLSTTRVNSTDLLLWSRPGLRAKLTAFAASRWLRGRVHTLKGNAIPELLRRVGNGPGPVLASLDDFVVDVPSLLRNLAGNHSARIAVGNDHRIEVTQAGITVYVADTSHAIRPRHLVLCAGAGNETLLDMLPFDTPTMQRRPLRQVLVKHPELPSLYGHELGSGSKPALTITSHRSSNGERIWYLGGSLAERGARLGEAACMDQAQTFLQASFPGFPWHQAQWSSLLIDRAEPAQAHGERPAGGYCRHLGTVGETSVIVAWPTKLSLVPNLAAQCEALLLPATDQQRPKLDLSAGAEWPFALPPWTSPHDDRCMNNWLRPLGQTGIRVSAIGLGTVKLGRSREVKYPLPFTIPDHPTAKRLLDCARDCGINLLDTAPAYGESEQRLGQLLRGQRNNWVVCSKVGEQWSGTGSRFDFSPEATRASVEASLRRLGCDELDLVLVHSDGNDLDIINTMGTLQALRDLQQRGLVRAVGFSPKTIAGGLAAAQHSDVVMVSYCAQDTSHEQVLERCGELGRGVLLKKVLGSGALIQNNQLRHSLALALDHPATGSAIIGTINTDHLRNNVDIARELLRHS